MIFLLQLLISPGFAATLVLGIPTTINSLDPFTIAGVDAYVVTGNVIEPLARSNAKTGQIIPVLAKSWTLNPMKKTFTVKIRENVKFHDGRALTAEDVKFTFEAYFKPEYKGGLWRGMWSDIKSAHVVDRLTIEFQMKSWSYQTFESILTSMRILPKSFYEPADQIKFRTGLIGTGPFKLKNYVNDRQLEFMPNENWWGIATPNFDVIVKHVATPSLAAEMMAKKSLDFYALGPNKLESEFVKKFRSGLGTGFWIDLNMKNELFRDRDVREALGLLWQRGKMNRKIFNGEMNIAEGIFSPATDIHTKEEMRRDDSPAAVKLLKTKGWSDSDQDGVLDKMKRNFEFTVLVNSAEQERWMTFFQNDAKASGIKVHIYRLEDDDQWLKRQKEGRFDAVARTGGLINEPTAVAWHTGAPYNYQSFSDAQVDKLTDELEKQFDLKKRRLILRKAIRRINELRPFVPGLYSVDEVFLISPRLKPDSEFPERAWTWKLL